MLRKELVKKSPIRVLEKSIHGGLGKGNLGVFTASEGVGKTACLIHVALDRLLRGKRVIHISFADDPHHIENWYTQVFREVASAYRLENTFEVYDQLLKLRLILHFKQPDIPIQHIDEQIALFSNKTENAKLVILDGFNFDKAKSEDLVKWKQFAEEKNVELWFSATLHRENLQLDSRGVPAPVNMFYNFFSVIIMMKPAKDHIELKLLKDHDSADLEKLRIKLDPHTLLLLNYRV